MAYDSIYTRINWENEKNTPLGATNLNKMDYALSEIDKRVVELSKQDENFATKDEIPEVEIATTENVGLVKPDGSTTYIDADGTIHAVGGGGGTGGTTDYNDLDNKPSINGITLEGAKTLDDLGITIPSTLDTLEEIETNTTPGKAAGALAVKEVTESLSSLYEQETTHYQEVNEALETHGTAISEISEVVSNGTVNHSKSATKAEQDQYGQNISTTYATNNDLSTEMMNQYRNIMVQVAEQISRLDERIDKTDESVSVATTEKTGTVKPDGLTITVDTDGTIHAVGGGGGTGGTTDYNDLDNKPSINGVELSGDKNAADLGITASDVGADASGSAAQALTDAKAYTDEKVPTKTSQLTNDSNFMTSYTETDPTVPSWAKASTKPSYTKDEIGLGNVDNTADSVKNVASATKATQDASGNVITTTYATKAELNNITVPTKISQLENDGKFVELDEYENLNVPQWVNAIGLETSDGIRDSGGIDEDNYYGGNAVVKTEDELSSLTAEGYMPDALLVKALHQRMGGYSFYNNPYVVYEMSTKEPFLLNGEYLLSDSDTGLNYTWDTENYYSAIVSGDYKRREGADTVSPFSGLGNIECVAELFSGDKYTTSKNCLIFVHGANTTESGLPTTIKPVVSSGILNELAKTTTKKWNGHYHAIAVYYLSLNGERSIISLASGSTPKALIFV